MRNAMEWLKVVHLKARIYNLLQDYLKEAVDLHISETETEISIALKGLKDRILAGFIKVKSKLSQKTITLTIAKSLHEATDDKNMFLSRATMKLFKEELVAANYLIKEGFI